MASNLFQNIKDRRSPELEEEQTTNENKSEAQFFMQLSHVGDHKLGQEHLQEGKHSSPCVFSDHLPCHCFDDNSKYALTWTGSTGVYRKW